MGFLDLKTIIFSYILTDIGSTIVIILLWLQNRKRFNGALYLVFDFAFQSLALILIALRGLIPDWISIDLANTLSVTGIYLGYVGLAKFLGLKHTKYFNYALLFLFPIIHSWFTFAHPNLAIRDLNSSVFFMILSLQYVYLLLYRVDRSMIKLTLGVGSVFAAYCLINLIRIIEFFANKHTATDYFNSGSFNVFVIISFQILFILLTYALVLMFNKRLLIDIALQEEKFSKAFYSSPYAIIITRLADSKIIDYNNGFKRISGFDSDSIVNKTTTEVLLWENENNRDEVLNCLRKEGKFKAKEFRFRKKSGEIITGLYSAEVLIINNEKCVMSSIDDITVRKNAEEKLIINEKRLSNLNATKDKFFSIIAHDLKSPFNSIMGFSELLVEQMREKDYDSIEKYADIIYNSSQRALKLLSNLLEWARIQTGKIEYNPEYVEIVSLINTEIDLLMDTAQQKSIKINQKLPRKLPFLVDKSMLSTVIRNLISNAIKFTREGGEIIINTEQRADKIIICVSDNGVGMNKSDIDKLFKMEESSSSPGTNNEHGTGLGLILCKEFVEKHNGNIRVESELGKGSKFCIELPIK